MANERSRDFGGAPSQGPDLGGAERRDPGADALLELARLIGGPNDPFAPEAPKANSRLSEPGFPEPRVSEQRLGDVSRAAASQADAGRDPLRSQDRSFDRRNPDFAEPRAPVAEPPDLPPVHDRGDYDFSDSRAGPHNGPTYRRRRDEDQYAGEYGDGEYGEPDDEGEENPPRRRPTKVIMAVLGLAVLGSAGAYGYRHWIDASPSGAPPVIRADNSPTKITPLSDVKADGGRIGDRGGEQLVRRDEDPVDLGTGAGGGSSEVMSAAGPGDPRRVHTVPIRADQGTASSSDRPAASRAPALPQPQAQAALAAPPPAPRQAVAPPLPPPQRLAAVAPAASAPPPDTSPAESGGYVVQLSAVRSEADAQTAFRQLQAKYPVLSGRQPLIRRKDQGERGIFFAAQIGPFGAKSDADQLCEQLKTAGGSCFVQRN
jgi:hypothetical protein